MDSKQHNGTFQEKKLVEKKLSEWPPLFKKREIQDVVHGPISLFHPLDKVVDTREFQRLRELKQQGVAYFVYPCSTHSRFVHSLGTYWLAYKFVESLKRDTSLNITSQDHLCVCLAALCHDLGHGPFSHVFEALLRDSGTKSDSHENLSIRLLSRIVREGSEAEAALKVYLGDGEEFKRNMTFVEELIDPPKKPDSELETDSERTQKWLPQGRPIEKAFLYDIVSNSNDSIDVDKFDYLLRDSFHAGIPIPFNKHSIERLTENARVLPDPKEGFKRICYAKKVADILLSVGDSRQMMHNLVYQHRVVLSIEEMVKKAMRLADKHIKFMDDGVEYNLLNVTRNLEAYLKTTDAVLRDIANSSNPEISEARNILEDINRRNFPVMIEEKEFAPSCAKSKQIRNQGAKLLMQQSDLRGEKSDLKDLISESLRKELGASYDEKNVMLLVRVLNRGLNDRTHPMTRVLLYDNKHNDNVVAEPVDEEWRRLKTPSEPAIWSLCLFVSRSMSTVDRTRVKDAFNAVVKKSGLRSPKSERKSSSTHSGESEGQ